MPRSKHLAAIVLGVGLVSLPAPRALAQDRGAPRLQELIRGITVTPRVLLMGAHPDDDDPALIAWLAHGHMVETAYLSLTRGEGGENYLSADVGSFLGAVRTEESLAARRIDGGRQFFTRAYDFGFARSADDAFERWPRDSVLGDIVTVIRSFRPQVVVVAFTDSISDGNGQHEAASVLAREAFAAAGDSVRFPSAVYGVPWQPRKLYRHGGALRIDSRQFDPVLGKSYVDLAVESRAQHRSQGLLPGPLHLSPVVLLDRIAQNSVAPVATGAPAAEQSIFDGIDTSFARLLPGLSEAEADTMRALAAAADSAKRALDLAQPDRIVQILANTARLANAARRSTISCRHPAAVTRFSAIHAPDAPQRCDQIGLDRDASIDLVEQRVIDALLIAAGVDIQATADRELIARNDTVPITITLRNRGRLPVTLGSVVADGVFQAPTRTVVVPPDSVGRAYAVVDELPDSRPWWFGPVVNGLFAASRVPVDGLTRSSTIPTGTTVPSVALPEELRRVSDATVSMTIAGVPVTTSVGPIVFHYANPLIGVRDRAVSGVPAVTLSFPRGLEWIVARKRVDRTERLSIASFSDKPQTFHLQLVTPAGLRVTAPPESMTVAPHEQRDIFLHMGGVLDSGRYAFGAAGKRPGALFIEGFQAVEYPHIPPVRVFHSSGFWLQTVDVRLPAHLSVAYVPGPGDDIVRALRDIGVSVTSLAADDLPSVDLSYFTTLVIGPRAVDAYPSLAAQRNRLMEFAQQGGTVVMLQQESPLSPFPLRFRFPRERVTSPQAPITLLQPHARLLEWPNRIGEADWMAWVDERAAFLPTSADARYTSFVEVHDRDQPANRNALLSARVGKGRFVYTTLSLQQQIASGVGGGLRLLVNLISAGLPGDPR